MRLRYLLGALCAAVSVCATAAIPAAEQTVAVEFYHPAADHHFITSEAAEINDLDTGKHPGWVRTGYRFSVIKAGSTLEGTVAMCRMFSESLNTHFYGIKPSECEDTAAKFPGVWTPESTEVFRSFPVDPTTGLCPADTTPAYRLWNQKPDANHRYTDQLAAYVFMIAKGYMPEGNGDPALPVAFCTPSGGDVVPAASPSAPNCTMTASTASPAPGSTLSLNATCTNNATTFLWQGCASTTSSCTATSATAGTAKYTLYAANEMGPGDPVVMNIAWGGAGGGGGPVPICTISASAAALTTGSTLTLTANCSQTPTSYEWMECNYLVQTICNPMPACSATSRTCSFGNTIGGPGYARYAVAASNAAGKGPRVPVDVEWTGSGGGGPPIPPPPGGGGNPTDPVPTCSVYASNDQPTVGSNVTLTASCTGNPTSYQWTGVSCNQWQCLATSGTPGSINYTVTASNAAGSAQASTTVVWGGVVPPNPVPSCTVEASNSSPQVGSSITVTATCSNSPTSFAWTGCTSTTASCTDSSATVGTKNYSVVATNANGSSQPVAAVVNWVAVPTTPPACTISASSTTPQVGSTITLTATCSNGPTSYNWTNCASTTSTCQASSSAAGSATYYVSGTNQYGAGNVAGVQVTWGTTPPPPPPGGGFCSEFSKVNTISLVWGETPSRHRTAQYGGFSQDTVFVLAVTVPSSPSSYGIPGWTTMVEYGGEPTIRKVTLSKSPCDFRPVDLTGANGPMDQGQGAQASIIWNAGIGNGSLLAPGGTYYFNFRNVNCGSSSCDALMETYWPR